MHVRKRAAAAHSIPRMAHSCLLMTCIGITSSAKQHVAAMQGCSQI